MFEKETEEKRMVAIDDKTFFIFSLLSSSSFLSFLLSSSSFLSLFYEISV